MSTHSKDMPPSAQSDLTLNEKQIRLRQCLVACIRPPPRFALEIRLGGKCTFAATFDRTAAGVRFGDVETSSDQIIVPAEIDLAAVEVDFERLTGAAGFQNIEETQEVWKSIKRLMQPALSSAVVHEPIENIHDVESESGMRLMSVKQLCTAAHNVQLFAYKARLNELQERCKHADEKASTQGKEKERTKRIEAARDDVRRVLSAENITNIQALTTWYTDGLFGEKGLKNLDAYHQWRVEGSRPENRNMPEPRSHSQEDLLLLTLIGRVLDVFPKLFDNAEACGEAYQARLRLHAYFCDQQSTLWRRFHQKNSAEQQVLLQWAESKGLLAYYKHTSSKSKPPDIPQLAWEWLQEKTGQSQSTIRGATLIGCHVKNMTALFGDAVLYFMDSCLETE
jgi:hypothetical protein